MSNKHVPCFHLKALIKPLENSKRGRFLSTQIIGVQIIGVFHFALKTECVGPEPGF